MSTDGATNLAQTPENALREMAIAAANNPVKMAEELHNPATATVAKVEITYDEEPVLTEILKGMQFDTPSDIYTWFSEEETDENGEVYKKNFFLYLYGLGKILKIKEESYKNEIGTLAKKIGNVDESFEKGAVVFQQTIKPKDASIVFEKSKLKDAVLKTITDSYENRYFDLIQQQQQYADATKALRRRKAWILTMLESPDAFNLIIDPIVRKADQIYNLYRGDRYIAIRTQLFNMVRAIATTPEALERSFLMNTSITGPAGSGKTTLARELAEWYSVLGLLTGDSFLLNKKLSFEEVGRSNLIASYLGQTAPKVMSAMYSSLEKTLFIDEAYSVAGCSFKEDGTLKGDDYGEEFLSTMLPFLANHKGLHAVVVAGYKNLMKKCFFDRNEGLPRRFPVQIDLPLYTTGELYAMMAKRVIEKALGPISKQITKDDGSVVENPLYKQAKNYKLTYYFGLAPTLFMVHYDTSYTALELLRKYILMFEIRQKDIAIDQRVEISSFSITNQVLTCILESLVRRNLIRYDFYKTIFEFEASNLSFLPAQAGEMELIADICLRSIEMNAVTQISKGGKPKYITFKEEESFFNKYFIDRERSVSINYKSVTGKKILYAEIIKTGYDFSKFQEQIFNYMISKAFEGVSIYRYEGGVYTPKSDAVTTATLPSLKELMQTLADSAQYNIIRENLLTFYAEKSIKNVTEIQAKTEIDFPVNMTRPDLEVELVKLKNGTYATDDVNLASSNIKYNQVVDSIAKGSPVLMNPKLRIDALRKEGLWEEIGYF